MLNFIKLNFIKIVTIIYILTIFSISVFIFSSMAYGMFSVKNNTEKDDYKKHININHFNKNYDWDRTYISSFKIRVTNEKASEDIYWMDKVGKDYNKIFIPDDGKTSPALSFYSSTLISTHISAYVTAIAYTEIEGGIETAQQCYIGFSELKLPQPEEVKRVRVIFNGLNSNYEPQIDFEVNEKHNILNPQRSVSFINEIKSFKNVIMK